MKVTYLYRYIFLILILGVYPNETLGQIYKYIGEDGAARYVNDYNKIPVLYRPEVKTYEEKISKEQRSIEINKPPLLKQTKKTIKQINQFYRAKRAKREIDERWQNLYKQIDNQIQELNNEYKALMIEKYQIERDIKIYSKRYKTRARKHVSRKKLKELGIQKSNWEDKYLEYKGKKQAFEIIRVLINQPLE